MCMVWVWSNFWEEKTRSRDGGGEEETNCHKSPSGPSNVCTKGQPVKALPFRPPGLSSPSSCFTFLPGTHFNFSSLNLLFFFIESKGLRLFHSSLCPQQPERSTAHSRLSASIFSMNEYKFQRNSLQGVE